MAQLPRPLLDFFRRHARAQHRIDKLAAHLLGHFVDGFGLRHLQRARLRALFGHQTVEFVEFFRNAHQRQIAARDAFHDNRRDVARQSAGQRLMLDAALRRGKLAIAPTARQQIGIAQRLQHVVPHLPQRGMSPRGDRDEPLVLQDHALARQIGHRPHDRFQPGPFGHQLFQLLPHLRGALRHLRLPIGDQRQRGLMRLAQRNAVGQNHDREFGLLGGFDHRFGQRADVRDRRDLRLRERRDRGEQFGLGGIERAARPDHLLRLRSRRCRGSVTTVAH